MNGFIKKHEMHSVFIEVEKSYSHFAAYEGLIVPPTYEILKKWADTNISEGWEPAGFEEMASAYIGYCEAKTNNFDSWIQWKN